jgi:hypothetical protein
VSAREWGWLLEALRKPCPLLATLNGLPTHACAHAHASALRVSAPDGAGGTAAAAGEEGSGGPSLLRGGLRELNMFKGHVSELARQAGGVRSLRDLRTVVVHLRVEGVGADGAAVVGALLPRSAATLTVLDLS